MLALFRYLTGKAKRRVQKLLMDHGIIKIVSITLLLCVLLFFLHSLKEVIIITLLFIAAVFSTFYTRLLQFNIGFELRTLLFVITSIHLGMMFGLMLTILAILLGTIIAANFQPTFLVTPLTYLVLAFILPFLKPFSIASIGVVVTIIYNLILHTLYKFTFGYPFVQSGPSLIGNLLFNIFIFTNYAQPISQMLG